MKLQEKVDNLIERKKKKFFSERPFSEYRLPCMVLAVSGIVFILFTSMFGVTVDTRTGEVNFQMEPGSDWSTPNPLPPEINPLVGKSGDTRFRANPMSQYPWFCFLAMILGYFIAVGMFIYIWFEYLRWKWMHVPEVIRFTEKKTKMEVKNND